MTTGGRINSIGVALPCFDNSQGAMQRQRRWWGVRFLRRERYDRKSLYTD